MPQRIRPFSSSQVILERPLAPTYRDDAEQEALDENIRFLRGEWAGDGEQSDINFHGWTNYSAELDDEDKDSDDVPRHTSLETRAGHLQSNLSSVHVSSPEHSLTYRESHQDWAPRSSHDRTVPSGQHDTASSGHSYRIGWNNQFSQREMTSLRDRIRVRRLRDHFATQARPVNDHPLLQHVEYAAAPETAGLNAVFDQSLSSHDAVTDPSHRSVRPETHSVPPPFGQALRFPSSASLGIRDSVENLASRMYPDSIVAGRYYSNDSGDEDFSDTVSQELDDRVERFAEMSWSNRGAMARGYLVLLHDMRRIEERSQPQNTARSLDRSTAAQPRSRQARRQLGLSESTHSGLVEAGDAGHEAFVRRDEETVQPSHIESHAPPLRISMPSRENRRRLNRHKRPNNAVSEAIRYLDSLRHCETAREGLEAAEERDFGPSILPHRPRDFVFQKTSIPSPPFTSWLQPGTVFSGHQFSSQNAMGDVASVNLRRNAAEQRTRLRNASQNDPGGQTYTRFPDLSSPGSSTQEEEPAVSLPRPPLPINKSDRWPVKFTVHKVNYNDMTISGTMEAFNVPDPAVPNRTSSIKTHLEGEILDFKNYSLETKSFLAGACVDANSWRKLPPFSVTKDDRSIVHDMLSKEWLADELMGKYILMRWKEKHFVDPLDIHSSLSINGFYYISLDRRTGSVAGLYYDPCSTPHKHLALTPQTKHFPAYEFQ